MMFAVGAILLVLGPVLAVMLAVGIPLVFGLLAYDVIETRRQENAARATVPAGSLKPGWSEATEKRIQLERGIARAFVILGGVFWALTAFAGLYWFSETGMQQAFLTALVPLVASLVTLIVGWYWERVASIMLVLASVATVYYGVAAQFELGVWVIVMFALIGPMITAAMLLWLARRDYEALEVFRLANAGEPALAEAEGPTF